MLHIPNDTLVQRTNQPGYKWWVGRAAMNGYVVRALHQGAL